MATVYKITPRAAWAEAEAAGEYAGSADDRRDGFVHLSIATQVPETVARHFAGVDDLVLVALDTELLGTDLRWEASRDGALFPHLYGRFGMDAVRWVVPLPRRPDGSHIFPDMD